MKLNKKFLMLLILLNFIGIFAAWNSYSHDLSNLVTQNNWYLLPLVPVSFILYFTMFLFLLFTYSNNKTPPFFTLFVYYFNFVYDLGAAIFYIIYQYFVGFSLLYSWYILAHLFLGVLALYVLKFIKKIRIYQIIVLISIVLIKNITDFYLGTTNYLRALNTIQVLIVTVFIIAFQILGFYILYRHSKTL